MDEGQKVNLDKQYNSNQQQGQNQPCQPYQQPPVRAAVYDTMPMKNNNIAIAGLVFGIFALIGFWIPFVDIVLSVIGIVCSSIGIAKQGKANGMSIGGLVVSIIALLLSVVFIIFYIIILSL